MADYKLILPAMGEGVLEATVTGWLKNVGDSVEEDESIVEIATDKVDSDVPTPVAGIIKEILVDVDGVAQVGEPIAILEVDGQISSIEEIHVEESIVNHEVEEAAHSLEEDIQHAEEIIENTNEADDSFYSPLVKSIAKEEGISNQDLSKITGTGLGGRVTKIDMQSYLSNRNTQKLEQNKTTDNSINNIVKKAKSQPIQNKIVQPAVTKLNAGPNEEIIEMDRMRKLIAKHMVSSVQQAPHVSSFVETDVTGVVMWRNKHKNIFQKREGEKLTFTPIFVQAVVKAIKDFPLINVSVDGDNIILKRNINIGIATAKPDGNLIVPVIKNADQYNLAGLAKKINDLAHRARTNKLKPDEIQGGTYTISNIGGFGNILGTPIINQPQVAILAVGAIEKKPAVIETELGDVIGIRHKMYLSHSYDHRVVDGALGGMFVKRVSDYLEQFDYEQEI